MALKAVLDSLDGVPEALHEHYKKDDASGKYRLEADGVEDVSGLKSALEKERTGHKTMAQQLKDLKEQLGDLDPVKAREALKKLQDLEDKKLMDAGKIDELVAQRMERANQDFQTQAKAFNSKIETITKERDAANGKLSELLIDGALRQAAVKAGIKPEAIEDAILWGKQLYRVKDGQVVPERNGQVLYGKDPNAPLPMEEWLAGMMTEKPHWFAESAGGGASGGKGKGGPSGIPANLKRSTMTVGQKSKFIADHGRDAYLKLPA